MYEVVQDLTFLLVSFRHRSGAELLIGVVAPTLVGRRQMA
jgi:hypothetical protein